MMDRTRCGCGWRRPLIAIVDTDGGAPNHKLVPAYNCPECGSPYISVEVTPEVSRAIHDVLELVGDATSSRKPTKPS